MQEDLKPFFESIETNIALNPNMLSFFTQKHIINIVQYAETNCSEDDKKEIADELVLLAENAVGETAFFLCSAALSLSKNACIHKTLLEYAYRDRDILGAENIFAIYQQSGNFTFSYPSTDSIDVLRLKNALYFWSLQKYKEVLRDYLVPIPAFSRKKDTAIVISQQVIATQHGPTKSALSRCKALINEGYKVLLVNTAEILTKTCNIKFIGETYASYRDDYLEAQSLEWEGVDIPFFQCEQNMPNYDTIVQLLQVIRDMKPAFVISIAAGTILEGLIAEIIPELSVPMTQSELVICGANYQAYSGTKDEKYYNCLNVLGFNESQIIETTFGFSILPQNSTHTREQLGIDETTFLLVTAGGRLQNEMDDDFLAVLKAITAAASNVKLLILGNYEKDPQNEDINDRIICAGFVDDVLSYMELCNLYINPHRKGGGTSCVEAMYKGIPVLTDHYGDVASNAGEAFCVKSYDDYAPAVQKYITDTDFYKSQSILALQRANELLNADKDFIRAVKELERRSAK